MPKATKALRGMKRPKSQSNDAYEAINDMVERHRPPVMIESDWGPRIGGPGAAGNKKRPNEFPVQINKPNRGRDTHLLLKHEYAKQRANGGDAALDIGEPHLNDRDLGAFEDLQKQKQKVSFAAWLSSYLNVADPATQRLVAEIMPEYYTDREAVIENQAELQKNLALIRMRGPQSKQDFLMIYLLSTGQIQMPKGSIFEPQSWSYDNTDFTRGMFNPRRYYAAGAIKDKSDPIGELAKGAAFGKMPQPSDASQAIGGLNRVGRSIMAGGLTNPNTGTPYGIVI
jgi:hypothetical protein